jgi:hypothetical protein
MIQAINSAIGNSVDKSIYEALASNEVEAEAMYQRDRSRNGEA